MKLHTVSAILFSLSIAFPAQAQYASAAPHSGQHQTRGGWGSEGFGGSGLLGTVTAVAADHYKIKTDAGNSYTIYFSASTRIMKQMIQRGGESAEGMGPQPLKPSEIKVGDAVGVMGEVNAAAKSAACSTRARLGDSDADCGSA